MQLLDRYLNAVRFWLPAGQQDDIIDELADDLRAEIGDRESDLGRPLTEAELAAIIKRRGDPVLVAGNYLDSKPVIGPALLPVYWFVVRLVTLWVLIPVFVLIVGPIEVSQSSNIGLAWTQTVWNLFMGQVFAFGVITIVFMCVERSKSVHGALATAVDNWDPSRLPALPAQEARQAKATPRSVAFAEIVSSIVIALVWLTLMWGPAQVHFDPVTITASPIWMIIRWEVLAVSLVTIGLGWYSLAKPYDTHSREITNLAIDAANFAAIVALLIANNWIILESTTLTPGALASATHWANFGIRIGLGVAGLFTGYSITDRLRRLRRKRPTSESSLLHTA